MIDMVRRHEIQVLRRAGHSLDETAKLVGVSRSSVQRVAAEPLVENCDTEAERALRAVDRPSKAEPFRSFLIGELSVEPDVLGRVAPPRQNPGVQPESIANRSKPWGPNRFDREQIESLGPNRIDREPSRSNPGGHTGPIANRSLPSVQSAPIANRSLPWVPTGSVASRSIPWVHTGPIANRSIPWVHT